MIPQPWHCSCVEWYLYDLRYMYQLKLAVFRREVEDGTASINQNPVYPRMPGWWMVPAPFGFCV